VGCIIRVLLLRLPAPLLVTVFTYELSSRVWATTFFSLHLSWALWSALLQLTSASCPDSAMTRSSRWITSLGSILDIFLCHKTYPSLASSFEFMFRCIDGTSIDERRSTSLLLQTARAGFHLVVWSRIVVGGATWLEIICRSAPRRNRLIEQVDRDYNVRNIVRFKLDALAEYVESFLPMPKFKLKSQLLLLVKVLGVLSLVPSSPPRLLPSDILVRSSLHSSFLRRSFSPPYDEYSG
jgi:hypothetical protein